jgi:hypothetical protein
MFQVLECSVNYYVIFNSAWQTGGLKLPTKFICLLELTWLVLLHHLNNIFYYHKFAQMFVTLTLQVFHS